MLRSTTGRMTPSKSSPNLASPSPSTPTRPAAAPKAQLPQATESSATFISELADGTVRQQVSFPGPCITLGRDPKTHLRLVKPNISRVHARVLLPSPGSEQPMTLNVTGGSGLFLNGAHLGAGAVTPLHSSDRICIDRWFFRVVLDVAPPTPEVMTPARGGAAPTPRRRTRMSLMDAAQIQTPRRRGPRRSSTTLYKAHGPHERDVILVEEIEEEADENQEQPDAENVESVKIASPTKESPRKRERRRSSFFGYAAADAPSASPDPASASVIVESTSAPVMPRLPHSHSSPSRLYSPIKNRKVSLRTQTLLRGCEEFIERERRAEILSARRSLLGASERLGVAEAELEQEAQGIVTQDIEDVEMSDAEAEDAAVAAAEEEEEQRQLQLQKGMTRSSFGSAKFEQDADADEVDRSLSLLEDVDDSDEEVNSTPSSKHERNDLGPFLTPQVQRYSAKSRTSLPSTVVRSGVTPDMTSWTAYLPAAVAEHEQRDDRSVEEIVREICEDWAGLATDHEGDDAEEEEQQFPELSSDEAAPAAEDVLYEPAVAALAHLLDAANVQGPETPAREALRSLVSASPTKVTTVAQVLVTPRYGGLYAAISASPAARLLRGSPKTPDMRGFARLFQRTNTAPAIVQPTPDAAFLKHIFALPPSEAEDVSIRDLRALFASHETELTKYDALDEETFGEDLKALLATPRAYDAVLKAAESIIRPATSTWPLLKEEQAQQGAESFEEEYVEVPVRRCSPSKRRRAQRQSLIPGPNEQTLLSELYAGEEQGASEPVEEERTDVVEPEQEVTSSSPLQPQVGMWQTDSEQEAAASQEEDAPTLARVDVISAQEQVEDTAPVEAPQESLPDEAPVPEQVSSTSTASFEPARALTPRSSVHRPRLSAASTTATPAPALAAASTPAATRTRRVAPAKASKSKVVAQTPKVLVEEAQVQLETPATTRRTRTRKEEALLAVPDFEVAAVEVEAENVPSSRVEVSATRNRSKAAPASKADADSSPSAVQVNSDRTASSDAAELDSEPGKAKRSTRKAATTAKSRLHKPAAAPSSSGVAAANDEENAGEALSSPMPKSRVRRAKSAVREVESPQPVEAEAEEAQKDEAEEAKTAPKTRATRAKAPAATSSKLPTRSRRGAAAAVVETSEVDEAGPSSTAAYESQGAAPAQRTRAKAAPTKASQRKTPSSHEDTATEHPLSELAGESNVPSSDADAPTSALEDAPPVKTRAKAKSAASGIATAKPVRKAASSAKAPSSDAVEAPVRATRSRAAKR